MTGSRILTPQAIDPDLRNPARLAAIEARLRALEFSRSGLYMTTVISAAGPLPLSATLNTYGGRLLIIASGSGYTTSAPVTGQGMNVNLNGTTVVTSSIGINANSVHQALPMVCYGPASVVHASPQTISLSATASFLTDATDLFTVLAIELL